MCKLKISELKPIITSTTMVLLSLIALSSCSINKMATSMVADAVASPQGTSVFSSDSDPQLVKDALPFALKMYESLLQSDPENRTLLNATAEGFISYANAFIHTPASMLEYQQLDRQKEMLQRARNMYIRGRDYALRSIEVDHPGFREALAGGKGFEQLQKMSEEDLPSLYWAAAGWMGAISAAGFDMGLLMELPRPVALAARALELQPEYKDGALHSLLLEIYGGIPDEQMLYGASELGGYTKQTLSGFYDRAGTADQAGPTDLEQKARFHFRRAVELSEGRAVGPYVALAGSFAVKNQDAGEYRQLLEKALAIEVDKYPSRRLENSILQDKARWMLNHIEDKFLVLD